MQGKIMGRKYENFENRVKIRVEKSESAETLVK